MVSKSLALFHKSLSTFWVFVSHTLISIVGSVCVCVYVPRFEDEDREVGSHSSVAQQLLTGQWQCGHLQQFRVNSESVCEGKCWHSQADFEHEWRLWAQFHCGCWQSGCLQICACLNSDSGHFGVCTHWNCKCWSYRWTTHHACWSVWGTWSRWVWLQHSYWATQPDLWSNINKQALQLTTGWC